MASDGDIDTNLEGETWDISYEALENIKRGRWSESVSSVTPASARVPIVFLLVLVLL